MASSPAPTSIDLLSVIRLLRTVGGALLTQASLHGELARVEWAEAKARLLRILVVGFAGFASLLCFLLMLGALVLAFTWDTTLRVPAAGVLLAAYGLASVRAWSYLSSALARSGETFAATREELLADWALLRSRL